MQFEYTDQQKSIQTAIEKVCANFNDSYWLERDTDGAFPEAFVKAITAGEWLGAATLET